MQGRRAYVWWWLIPVLLVGFWLGARGLYARPLWGDEVRSTIDAIGDVNQPRTPAEIWGRVSESNPYHAPGYFVLLNTWGRLTGWQPPVLRALSLLLGLAAVAMTYRLGRDLLSPRVGLFAALVLVTSAFYVRYLYDMRVYSLIALLSTFTIWAYIRVVSSPRPPSRRLWLALFAGASGILYSHYIASILLAVIGLHLLLFVRKDRRWWMVVGILAAAGVLFLPWAQVMLKGVGLAEESESLHAEALTTPAAFAGFLTMFSNGVIPVFLAGVALAVTAAGGRTAYARGVRLLLFVAAVALAFILGVNQVMMIMHEGRLRYLMPLWPLFALVVGVGVAALRRWPALMAGALALWAAVGLWTCLFVDFTARLDGGAVVFPAHRVAAALRDRVLPDDLVVNYLSDDEERSDAVDYRLTMRFYFEPLHVDQMIVQGDSTREQPGNAADVLAELAEHPRLWIAFVPSPAPKSLPVLEAALGATFERCATVYDQPDVNVDLYVNTRAGVTCPPTPALEIR